ncbi:HAD family hydrolase [Phytomonospora endophytica]|uniref:HAD superfamily hydrolase (TIGR01509 family) n=1 Tax=Phytomonospora endophytica TaxID=714109 RepID=A0A841FGB7_9ACTN|nr:HAD family phosphatase [Phytomonospora endophytica]MBB6035296.1 HAD superfamily hydrolase (TIGR01509 family) [Phytomonospora endophytica]GIG63955.1 hydrolase [Phytomonospora endophytica]
MPKLVIFDNDGVLVDSERLSNVVFAEMITAAGLPTTFEESVDLYMGKRTTDCVPLVESLLGAPLPAGFIAEYEQRCGDLLRRELVAVDGVTDLLETLQRDGTAYCIASSGTPAEIDLRLTVTGLAEHFENEWIHSGVMVANGKPAPDLFEYAAAQHGVSPAECVVIEDSIAGVTGAKAAGMFVIGHAALLPGNRLAEAGADIVVGSMREVKGLLPEL